jgi:hypothetical protein
VAEPAQIVRVAGDNGDVAALVLELSLHGVLDVQGHTGDTGLARTRRIHENDAVQRL